MRGFLAKLCKKNGIVKRIFSLALSVMMMTSVVQCLPAGILVAHAADGFEGSITLHYENAAQWGNVNAWVWDNAGNNYTGGSNNWPGLAMTDTDSDGWYDITLSVSLSDGVLNMIFNNGTAQTGNLNHTVAAGTTELWISGGTSGNNVTTTKPGSSSGTTTGFEGDITLHYENTPNWSNVYVWAWNDSSNFTGGQWPGKELGDADGDGWFDTTISVNLSDNTLKMVFNNNTDDSNKTADIIYTVAAGTTDLWITGGKGATKDTVTTTKPDSSSGTTTGFEGDITLHYENTAGWSNVYTWAWNDSSNFTGGQWPGKELSDVDGDGWFDTTISVNLPDNTLKMLFNNNTDDSNKTADIIYTVAAGTTDLWIAGGKEATKETVTTTKPAEVADFTSNITLHFKNDASWSAVYSYMWDSSNEQLLGGFPGTQIGENSKNTGWYEVTLSFSEDEPLSKGKLNMIFSDGNDDNSKKTADIKYTIPAGVTDLWITGGKNATIDTIATTAPEGWVEGGVVKKSLKIHYYNASNWDAVGAYLYADTNVLAGEWPGTTATKEDANDNSNKWYAVEVANLTVDSFKVIMNNTLNSDNGGQQDSEIDITLTKAATELWIKDGEVTDYDPGAIRSPIVNGREVTFNYENSSVTEVYLRGDMTDWATNQVKMTETDDVFSVTVTVSPGKYGYKFWYPTDTWVKDPLNGATTGDNSLLIVAGLEDDTVEASRKKDAEATLPEQLAYYDAKGKLTNVDVTYALKNSADSSFAAVSGNTFTITADNTAETVELIATATVDGQQVTSNVTVKLVDNLFKYTVYAYSAIADRNNINNTAVYIWDKAEETDLAKGDHALTTTEVLGDGRTWMKMEISLSCSQEIGFILKSKDGWGWQSKDLIFTNAAKTDQTIYLVDGYSRVFTDLADVPQDTWLYVEYTRADASYANTYAYAWENGYTYKENEVEKNLSYKVESINGKYIAKIPVAMGDTDKEVKFIMQKGTDLSNKDGGDNTVTISAGQQVTKVRFSNGKITYVVPSSKGFEMDRTNGKIGFYYRDEALFADCNLSSLTDVKLVLRTATGTAAPSAETTYTMTYDAVDDRFEYENLTLMEDTDYYYYYLVNGTKILDANNQRTGTVDGTTYSLCRNKVYKLNLNATLKYNEMNYDQGNVLYLNWTPKTANDSLDGFNPEKVYVDLSQLGLDSKTEMDTELMALSFGCSQEATIGGKAITVTLIDDCDMTYTATVTVNVTARTKTANTDEKLGDFDWDEAVIYFAITDRFFDGNESNNLGDPNSTADDAAYKEGDGGSYHGGDFAGLTEKIDYLYDLGVNTIWLTPIVDNIDFNLDTENQYTDCESYGYHGYWASDFTSLNPHLGTEAEFEALITAAHAKGMKVMVDVVLNHAGYYNDETKAEFDATFGTMVRDASTTIPGDQQKDGLSGLPDFVTEDPEVRAQLIEWQTGWMTDYDIDYYRVDTVKHVENTTWSAFKNALIEENQDFKLIGEYYDAGYLNDFDQLDSGRMDSVLDFNFNDLMMKLADEDLATISNELSDRNALLSNTATVGSFTSSHDEPGLLYNLTAAENGDSTWATALMKVAAAYQITAKGQPVIYYGEELGLTGANNYPYQDNRYDFDWTLQATQANTEGSMYNHYKTLLNIRRDYSEVFAKGTRNQVVTPLITDENGNSISQGYEVFSRSYNGQTLYVGVNVWGDAKTTDVYVGGTAGSVYTDLYNNKTYTVADDGTITISIPGAQDGGTAILVKTSGGSIAATDSNKLTLKLHYTRTDNNYTDWNAWIWADGMGGKGYEFKEENGEMVATVTVDARATTSLWYRIRLGDWKANDHNAKNQKIDLSDIVSGTVHFYVDQGVFGGTRVLGSNAICGNKIVKTAYDRSTNKVTVTMSMPISGVLSEAFAINCTSTDTAIGITEVEENGTEYVLSLAQDISSMSALLKSYTITFDGYTYNLTTPNIYSSEEFENAYTYEGDDLGLTYTKSASTFKLWAPTADSVKLNVYTSGTKGTDDLEGTYTMTLGEKGVWSYTLSGDWNGKYYTYSVDVNNSVNEVCDPYARTTGVNGNRAMILDLDSTDPEGWDSDTGAHANMDYTDAIIYELHVRDLSIDDSSGVSEENQGKFLGLTETGTKTEGGMPTALDHMINLGVTHLHLIPVYDYGSVDETKLDTEQFNWGYDPVNYNVPEGSYSTNPYDGATRVTEMKQMIQTLHDNNINVVMDVVYNHVYDAESFAFNQVVPKYFSRTNEDGSYSDGSGCGNDTASERSMVHKYIVESILYWHEEYHIDGFRFDLVGLIDTETINTIVEEVHKVDPSIIFYGEGWTLGTAVSKSGYTMATQANAASTPDFAYFSDTFRDGVAGNNTNGYGFIWGSNNESTMAACYLARPSWTNKPTQTINYASCHDNYTLMDKINEVSGANVTSYDYTPGEYQVKLNNLTAAYYMFAQGIPLIHAGEDFLRIKLDENGTVIHNSYNSPDYVNKLRWYNLDTPVYADTTAYYKGLIEFRKNHAALRLSTTQEVTDNVKSHILKSSVILYEINGKASVTDEVADKIITIYNASSADYTVQNAYGIVSGSEWKVCVDIDNAGTEVLRTITDGKVTVPAHSAMVLVKGETVDTDSVYTQNNKATINLDKTEVTTGINDVVLIGATVNPENATLTWVSSDETVATVDKDGRVTTLADGTATITVSTYHGVEATCEVTVDSSVPVEEKAQINKPSLTLQEGESGKLIFAAAPVGNTYTVASSDTSVVTVDAEGNVVAVAPGSATITVTTAGGKTATCTVTVTAKPVETIPPTQTPSQPGGTGTTTPAPTPAPTPSTDTNAGVTDGATQGSTQGTTTVTKDMEVKVETEAETEVPENVDKVTPIVDKDLKEAVKKETEKLLEDIVNDEVAEGVLSEETLENIKKAREDGEGIITEVIVESVDEDTVDTDVKEALQKALAASVEGTVGAKAQIAQYLDLSVLLKTTSGQELGTINKLSKPVTFTIAVPEDMMQEGRVFVVLRMHEGETTVLETTMNADGTISFETDRFSTYALAYIDMVSDETEGDTVVEDVAQGTDKAEEEGVNYTAFIIIGIIIIILAALFIIFLALKNKKKEQ